jgi:hypothetical protein
VENFADAPVEYKRVAFLIALGWDLESVAAECKVSVSKVKHLCQEPYIIEYVKDFREAKFIAGESALRMAYDALPTAISKLVECMNDDDAAWKDRVTAARTMLDHDPSGLFAKKKDVTHNHNHTHRIQDTLEAIKETAITIAARPVFNPVKEVGHA